MHEQFIAQFAIIIGIASLVGITLHTLKQPLVPAYLLAGILMSFFTPLVVVLSHGPLEVLPTVGIAFLLFLIGLELDFSQIKDIGKPILLAGLSEITFTTAIVASLMGLLGFTPIEAILIGLAISFSSTIVVIKVLVDKQEISAFHGKVAISMLIIEDLVAVAILMILPYFHDLSAISISSIIPVSLFFIKGFVLFGIMVFLMRFVIDRLLRFIATNQELLFLTAIAWCFLFITLATVLGFSLEIGAFLGGISLASTPYRFQIAGRLKPLRDFFIAIFFINLGLGVVFADFVTNLPNIALFSVLALVVKPIELLVILSVLGFKRYTVYQVATTLSQISEFSIIMFVIAQRLGVIQNNQLVSAIALSTIITIFISSILVNQNHRLYGIIRKILIRFERKKYIKEAHNTDLVDHVILIGVNRAGSVILDFLKKQKEHKFIAVDYNPHLVQDIEKQETPVLFGDVSDPDILEQLNLKEAKLVISTVRELKENLIMLENAKSIGAKAIFIVSASDDDEKKQLLKHGADEVVIPLSLEGHHITQVLQHHWDDLSYFKKS